MLKKVLIVVGILVVIVALVLVYVTRNLDRVVKRVIERVGTKILDVDVSVGGVDLSLSEGMGTIRKLTVANPPGFSSEPMMDFGELSLDADFKNSVINKIYVESPHFLFEEKGETSNFEVLQKNLGKEVEPERQSEEEKEEPREDETGDEKVSAGEEESTVLQIDLFEIKDAKVTFVSDQDEETKEITIEHLVFKDLKGTGEQICKQLMSQLARDVIGEVTKRIIKRRARRGVVRELIH